MQTLIAYTTRHGTTLRYCLALARELAGEVTLVDLRDEPAIDISLFDTVILGGAVYAGRVAKELREFCSANKEALAQKRLGFFVCGWHEGEAAQEQLEAAFPHELLSIAAARACFGGEMNLAEMSLFERLIVKMVAKVQGNASRYSDEAVREFARALRES